ncbi:MAG: hypothetical protein MJZ77_05565 [Bacteroidales bacterium]|nr:hypothetical protein [Bacteroidales bacterium]
MKKEVFRTLFHRGFAISTKFQPYIQAASIAPLNRGESRKISLIIGGQICPATMYNQQSPQSHSDILQIRYTDNSKAAQQMRALFPASFNFFESAYAPDINGLRLPDEMREYFILQSTVQPDVFEVIAITQYDLSEIETEIENVSESDFENMIDGNAGYKTSKTMGKFRSINKSIGESLKKIYDYRCQITGEKIGDKYSALVVEAHHIEPFTTSLNNNADNIIILSPTFHRIIHKESPTFVRNNLEFVFPNGVKEKVRLDYHLRAK